MVIGQGHEVMPIEARHPVLALSIICSMGDGKTDVRVSGHGFRGCGKTRFEGRPEIYPRCKCNVMIAGFSPWACFLARSGFFRSLFSRAVKGQ